MIRYESTIHLYREKKMFPHYEQLQKATTKSDYTTSNNNNDLEQIGRAHV